MKTLKYILPIIAIFLFSTKVKAQTAHEIIEKHINAHGGEKNWAKIENMKIEARFTAFSIEKDFYAYKTKQGEYYSKLHLGKHAVEEAFDGKKGWTIDPWHDFSFPRELNKNENNVFLQKAEFFTPFYNYKAKGHTVEYLGEKDIEGVKVHTLKLSRKNGISETWYLDAETFLEYKCESMWVDFAYPIACETFFDDFRTVNGVVIPFYVERMFSQRNRILEIENIEFNADFDKSLLKMPRSNEMEALKFLEGKHKVKVEVMTRRGWYNIDNPESEIEFASTNLLSEKISYNTLYYVYTKHTQISFSSENEKYRMSVYNAFSSDMDIFEGELNDSVLVFNKLSPKGNESKSKTQIVITKTGKGFTLELKQSNDGGEKWRSSEKLTYIKE